MSETQEIEMAAKTTAYTVTTVADLDNFKHNPYNLRDLDKVAIQPVWEGSDITHFALDNSIICDESYREEANKLIESIITRKGDKWHFEAKIEFIVTPKIKLTEDEKPSYYLLDGNGRFKILKKLIAYSGIENTTFSFRYTIKGDFPKDDEGIKAELIAASISGYNTAIPVTTEIQEQLTKVFTMFSSTGLSDEEALDRVKDVVKTNRNTLSQFRRAVLNKDLLEKAKADKYLNLQGQATYLSKIDEFVEKTGKTVDEAIEAFDLPSYAKSIGKERLTSPKHWDGLYNDVKNHYYPDLKPNTEAAINQGTEVVNSNGTVAIPDPTVPKSKVNQPSKIYSKDDIESILSDVTEATDAAATLIDEDKNLDNLMIALTQQLATFAYAASPLADKMAMVGYLQQLIENQVATFTEDNLEAHNQLKALEKYTDRVMKITHPQVADNPKVVQSETVPDEQLNPLG